MDNQQQVERYYVSWPVISAWIGLIGAFGLLFVLAFTGELRFG